MNGIKGTFHAVVGLAVLAGWLVLVHDYHVPLVWGAVLGAAVLVVVFWLLFRARVFPPPTSGWNW